MATLNTTLGTAKTPSYNYSTYGYPRPRSPYPQYRAGGGPNFSTPDQQNVGLYSALFQQGQQQQAAAPPSSNYQAQYDFDPILARISAMSRMNVNEARNENVGIRKQALIDAGDPQIAQELGADANTIEAAKQNTFGTSQRLAHDYAERSRQLDEAMNKQNLYFGGERINQMAEQERGRSQAYTDFGAALRSLLGQSQRQLAFTEADAIKQAAAAAAGARVAPPPGGGGGPAGPPAGPPGGSPGPPPPYTMTGDNHPDWGPPQIVEAPVPINAFAGDGVTQAIDPLIALALGRDQRLGF